MENRNLGAFEVIVEFINDLCEFFGSKHKPLKLYKRLLEHVTLADKTHIKKHLDVFRGFCENNRAAIQQKNKEMIREGGFSELRFSDKVFINMNLVFDISPDEATIDTIWKHLLTISAYLDPDSNAKEILKADKAKELLKSSSGSEVNFLSDIISKVESSIDPGKNPQDAMSSIMNSSSFGDIVKSMTEGVQDGNLDLGKLLGTVTQMVGTLNEGSDAPVNLEPIMNMVSSLVGNMGDMGGHPPSKVEAVDDSEVS